MASTTNLIVLLIISTIFVIQNVQAEERGLDFEVFTPIKRPRDSTVARSILGYDIYDRAPVQHNRAVKFGNDWEKFASNIDPVFNNNNQREREDLGYERTNSYPRYF